MSDAVETYAGLWNPWWDGISTTVKSKTILAEAVNAESMRKAAGLDWEIMKQPAFVTGEHAGRIPGWNAVQRKTDGAIFGMVSDSYRLFQNEEGFEFLEALMQQGNVEYVSGGALFGGAFAWALAKVDEFTVHGDDSPYADYLLGYWGHDGRHGFTVADTAVRVVCANTATAAIAGSKNKVTIRHTANMEARLAAARKTLDIHSEYSKRLQKVLADLAKRPMTTPEVTNFTVKLLPANPDVEHAYRTEADRLAIVNLFQASPTLVGVAPTAYRAYQATTEWLDHVKVVKDTKTEKASDRRALSIIEGGAADLKATALKLLAKA